MIVSEKIVTEETHTVMVVILFWNNYDWVNIILTNNNISKISETD